MVPNRLINRGRLLAQAVVNNNGNNDNVMNENVMVLAISRPGSREGLELAMTAPSEGEKRVN